MTGHVLAKQFEMNRSTLLAALEGLSHADSLTHPKPAGNCLNWVVGHIVATRNGLLAALGESPIWNDSEASPYARGSKPPLEPTMARPLDDLVQAFNRSNETIVCRLEALTNPELERSGPHGTLGELIAIYSFHESYHIGQCGLLRRLSGREGAVG